ncbi:MAG: hypothetical protein DMF95_11860 [Acidobacteria bacterium]|nr:MAG: hypothetical protein DMF95_11860 [Acidobacteriota bacterium]
MTYVASGFSRAVVSAWAVPPEGGLMEREASSRAAPVTRSAKAFSRALGEIRPAASRTDPSAARLLARPDAARIIVDRAIELIRTAASRNHRQVGADALWYADRIHKHFPGGRSMSRMTIKMLLVAIVASFAIASMAEAAPKKAVRHLEEEVDRRFQGETPRAGGQGHGEEIDNHEGDREAQTAHQAPLIRSSST